jgi:urea carboxylase
VTEAVYGIDLVAWMLRLAQGDDAMFDGAPPAARGHAIEPRVYAEDPSADYRPSAGVLTEVSFPDDLRVDGWVQAGSEISTAYDPLLTKLVASGSTREEALQRLASGLRATRIGGIRTNLGLLRAALGTPAFRDVGHSTATLASVTDEQARIEVLRAGRMTTVQDWPGRTGLWAVGVPPSGAIDDRSFRAGNCALGNPEGAAGLECTIAGPALRFSAATTVCVCGGEAPVTLDGEPVARWQPVAVPAGGVLDVGTIDGLGLRSYVLFAGGLDVPDYLGSAATFTLGCFGGHGGRALRGGDVLSACTQPDDAPPPRMVPEPERSPLTGEWEVAVVEGPHAAPEFFTSADIESFYAHPWEVHFNSDRTGVRLVGPRPVWARPDGGDAGLHPSNIHDTPYSVGAVDFTGDVPILLGPDGPSLGGFVCPATVVTAERWKLGQMRPGDTVRFIAVSQDDAAAMRMIASRTRRRRALRPLPDEDRDNGVVGRVPAGDDTPEVTYRRCGDDNLLVEYGPMVLDLGLRMRVHALAERLAADGMEGVVDLTPGIRSLQIHVDPDRLALRRLLSIVRTLEDELPATHELAVRSRIVHLPLSWDDPATREATDRYMSGVRGDAPWCPWNIEFIRRVNGLGSVEDVRRIVFDADYIVLGLGDVYLGAPVATPLDPRHRLVTTKYNPARTWTPENAVGIGGAYLCIYGIEGPGGYQFVGRTTQVWSRYRTDAPFKPGSPWLLRFFDRIRWHPVGAEELLELRADLAAGRLPIEIEEGNFTLADNIAFVEREAEGIAAFREQQSTAFETERLAWAAAGEFDPRPETITAPTNGHEPPFDLPPEATVIEAPLSASIWRVEVDAGDEVTAGQRLLTLEAMKMEAALDSPVDGEIVEVLVSAGDEVVSGAALVVVAAQTQA